MSDFESLPFPSRPTLTEEQKDLILSSAPLLKPEVYGQKITQTMYFKMLNENPQLKNVFSQSKQAVRPSFPLQYIFSYKLKRQPLVLSEVRKHWPWLSLSRRMLLTYTNSPRFTRRLSV